MTPKYEKLSFLGATFLDALCNECKPEQYVGGVHKGYGDDVEPVTKREFRTVDKRVREHEKVKGHEVVIFLAENRKV